MRKNRFVAAQNEISILVLDDDKMITLSLQAYFQASGYSVEIENDPNTAIERLKSKHFDILLLDYLMTPICGDEVVSRVRTFDKDLFIIMLTGHKSMVPPIRTIRELDIQGYYEKGNRFDQLELLVESCVKSIRQMRTIRSYRDGLDRIAETSPLIYRLQPLDKLLGTLIESVKTVLGADSFVFAEIPYSYADTHGIDREHFGASERYFDREPFAKKLLANFRAGHPPEDPKFLIKPLIDEKHDVFGVLAVNRNEVAAHETALLDILSRQASGAFCNVTLHALVNTKNSDLESANAKLNKNYFDMISAVRSMVDTRDIHTRGHSDRVSYLSELIAKEMGLPEEFCKRIRVAGLFHDIGKIGIPDSILLKPTALTEEEFAEIKTHPLRGYAILSPISVFSDIAEIVLQHHERVDGRGYPKGLLGDNILLEAKIIAAADAFDAMTSFRQYRNSLSFDYALSELREGKNSQFDSNVVDAFLRVLQNYDMIKKDLAWTVSDPASK